MPARTITVQRVVQPQHGFERTTRNVCLVGSGQSVMSRWQLLTVAFAARVGTWPNAASVLWTR